MLNQQIPTIYHHHHHSYLRNAHTNSIFNNGIYKVFYTTKRFTTNHVENLCCLLVYFSFSHPAPPLFLTTSRWNFFNINFGDDDSDISALNFMYTQYTLIKLIVYAAPNQIPNDSYILKSMSMWLFACKLIEGITVQNWQEM